MTPDHPDLTSRNYRAYTLNHSEEDAAAEFARRYGTPPEWVWPANNVLWVGPIPEPVQILHQLTFEIG